MAWGVHKVCVNLFGVCVLVFNALLVYSLFTEKNSVHTNVWAVLVAREVFGFIYFLIIVR